MVKDAHLPDGPEDIDCLSGKSASPRQARPQDHHDHRLVDISGDPHLQPGSGSIDPENENLRPRDPADRHSRRTERPPDDILRVKPGRTPPVRPDRRAVREHRDVIRADGDSPHLEIRCPAPVPDEGGCDDLRSFQQNPERQDPFLKGQRTGRIPHRFSIRASELQRAPNFSAIQKVSPPSMNSRKFRAACRPG